MPVSTPLSMLMGKPTASSATPISMQRELVKKGLMAELVLGDNWEILPMEWFNRWKAYTNFDISVNGIEQEAVVDETLHPGNIDTSSLYGYGDELNCMLSQNIDYILLPDQQCTNRLVNIYGHVGIRMLKRVININSTYHPILQIDLFPIRCEFRKITKAKMKAAVADAFSLPVEHTLYCFTNATISDMMHDACKGLNCSNMTAKVRLWVKIYPSTDDTAGATTDDTAGATTDDTTAVLDMDISVSGSNINDSGRVGRKITCSIADQCGEWRYLRHVQSIKVPQLLQMTNSKFVECIIEVPDSQPYLGDPKERDYPLTMCLNDWRRNLVIGDIVDVKYKGKDDKFSWWEGSITDIDEATGSYTCHFLGFPSDQDQIITKEQSMLKLSPLHSHTRNWRDTLEEFDVIDIYNNDVWDIGTVDEVDSATRRVKVKCCPTATTVDNPTDGDSLGGAYDMEMCDDDKIKETTANPPLVIALPYIPTVYRWIDLDSEDICSAYTHTVRPAYVGYSNLATNRKPTYTYNDYTEKHVKGIPLAKGAVGLKNLGNTCFMNSILQCMSSSSVLKDFFTSDSYKSQINNDNPLGHNGKVASIYGKLMKDMWCSQYSVVVPRDFKDTIGEFQPQFSGYQQQDSQELLGFLLDGLHEDLNRIKKKPFVAKIESKGRSDDLISRESWRRYLLRNDSFIVDNCFGQYRSHLTCTNCGNESVTFEAYSSLSLPIPVSSTKTLTVIVQLQPLTSIPVSVDVDVGMCDTVQQLKEKLIERLEKLGYCSRQHVKEMSVDDDDFVNVTYNDACESDDGNVDGNADGIKKTRMNGDGSTTSDCRTSKEDDDIDMMMPSYPKINDSNAEYTQQAVEAYLSKRSMTLNPAAIQIATPWSKENLKAHNTLESTNTVSSFKSDDTFLAFELAHICPEGYFYNSRKPYSYTIDVMFAKLSEKTSYNDGRYEHYGYPWKIAATRDMSNQQMHRLVYDMMTRFLAHTATGSTSYDSTPYELKLCSYNSATDFPDNTDVCTIPDRHILTIVWNELERSPAFVDEVNRCRAATAIDGNGSDSSDDKLNVYKCFDKFIEREHLAPEDTWYCSTCNQHKAPIKKMDVWTTPNILIIHLKRFLYAQGRTFVHREKISELIDFPVEGLDMSSYVLGPSCASSPPIYDLYAVSLHSGGLGGGHYTAVCKNSEKNQWYNFNDSYVSETTSDAAVCKSAYVLFYKRRNGDTTPWGGLTPLEAGIPDE